LKTIGGGGGGEFGGKNLRGKFWREYFGVEFWRLFCGGGGILEGNYIFFARGHLEGKTHYACYNNVIGTMSISIILCFEREGMASSNK
jgi:hypothetical protein